jgi:hypothetical protein
MEASAATISCYAKAGRRSSRGEISRSGLNEEEKERYGKKEIKLRWGKGDRKVREKGNTYLNIFNFKYLYEILKFIVCADARECTPFFLQMEKGPNTSSTLTTHKVVDKGKEHLTKNLSASWMIASREEYSSLICSQRSNCSVQSKST